MAEPLIRADGVVDADRPARPLPAPARPGRTGVGGASSGPTPWPTCSPCWPPGCSHPPPTASWRRCWASCSWARCRPPVCRPRPRCTSADAAAAARRRPGPAARGRAGHGPGRRRRRACSPPRPLAALLHLPDAARRRLARRAAAAVDPRRRGTRGSCRAPGRYGRLAAVNGVPRAGQAGRRHRRPAHGRDTDGRARRDDRRRRRRRRWPAGSAAAGRACRAGLRAPLAAALRASGALLGFVLLLNLDLLLARHHLTAAHAGEYAVGAIFAKVAFWLPQGVGVVLLPRLADEAHRRRLLPGRPGAGRRRRRACSPLGTRRARAPPRCRWSAARRTATRSGAATWLFACLGTLLALAQLLLYSGIAASDRLAVGSGLGGGGGGGRRRRRCWRPPAGCRSRRSRSPRCGTAARAGRASGCSARGAGGRVPPEG